jgi:ribosomal protein S18 acetylase RimI-like enzyme
MIRHVAQRDYSDILLIKKKLLLDASKINEPSYRVTTEKSGFFLYKKPQSMEVFVNDLEKVYFVYEENGKVKGYVRIDKEQEMARDAYVFWFRPELKDLYFSLPHAAMAGIGLLPEIAHKGIAKELLAAATAEVKKENISYLFSFIALSPMTNIASMLFHERNGFERIATCTIPELFGLKNYQSILYGKKL